MTEINPLLETSGPIPYDRIRPAHVVPGVRAWLASVESQLAALEAAVPSDAAELLERLDEIDRSREYAWSPVRHLLGVMNSAELRTAVEEVEPEVVAFGLKMGQSRPLYDALQKIRSSEGWSTLSSAQRRVIEAALLSAKHAGVGLDGAARERFDAINKEAAKLSTDYDNNVLDATTAFELIVVDPAETEGWPETLRHLTSQSYVQAKEGSESTPDDGPWRVTLDIPIYMGIMRHSRVSEHRRTVMLARLRRATEGEWDNKPILQRMLELRREMALLLGYETYAQLSLAEKMAPSVEAVRDLMDKVLEPAKAHDERELQELRQFAADKGHEGELRHWDVPFWSERLQEERFGYTEEELRPYFPLPKVLDGLFGLCTTLFDVRVEPADGSAPTWHPDVRTFEIRDSDGEVIGSFLLDPYSRPGQKRGGAWMGSIRDKRRVGDELVLPVASLHCNGTPPTGDRPSLMTFSEVHTLFHEFGHGLQHMLTRIDEPAVAGINGIEWDAVEIASQFMENWLYHRPTLLGMTEHVVTKERLPDELFDKLCAARTFQSGGGLARQIVFGATDMELHHEHDPGGSRSPFEVYLHHATRAQAMPPLPESPLMLCAFSHLFAGGYAAGYYSYLWSDVLSADAFSAFEEAGLDDTDKIAELGRRYRDTILGLGGSQPPAEVFRAFRGRDPDPAAMLRHRGLDQPA